MKRNPIKTSKKHAALTNPHPSFVSLVAAGANQRPFRVVKAEDAGAPDSEKDQTMSTVTPVQPGYEIAALRFDRASFPSIASVSAWLEEGGYADFEVAEKEDAFEVVNKTVVFVEGSVEEVAGVVEGLTTLVGKLSVPEEAERSTEEIAAAHAETNPSAVTPVAKTEGEGEGEGEAAPVTEVKEDVGAGSDDAGEPTGVAGEDEPAPDAVARTAAEGLVSTTKAANFYAVSSLAEKAIEIGWTIDEAEWLDLDAADIAALRAAAQSILSVVASLSGKALAKLNDRLSGALTQRSEAPVEPVAETIEETPAEPAVETPDEIQALRAAVAALTETVTGLVSAQKGEGDAPASAEQIERSDPPVEVPTRKGSGEGTEAQDAQPAQEQDEVKRHAAENFARSLGLRTSPGF